MKKEEMGRLQDYMRGVFKVKGLQIKARPQKDDSAEVYIDDEFIGIIYRDDEDEDLCYNFNMAILDFDLEQ
ncbi:MAG: DUF3126 family protein [Hyphomicrobiaceae bacterium]|nr:DUF3126 family protein [Hyphomicrobiaceae bacterium]